MCHIILLLVLLVGDAKNNITDVGLHGFGGIDMDGLLDALGSLGTAIVDAYNDKIKDKLNNTIDQ